MSDQSKGVNVETLKFHTFAGKEYHEGDQYVVHGDAVRSTEEYIETLRAIGFAKPVGEESAHVVNEVGSEASHKADAGRAKAKLKDTRVEPLSAGAADAVAGQKPIAVSSKPIETPKPAESSRQDVQTNKK